MFCAPNRKRILLISILRSMNARERLDTDQLVRKSIDCYLSAIQMFEKHASEASPDEWQAHRERVGAIHRQVFSDQSVAGLEHSRTALEQEVEGYAAKVALHHQDSKLEVKQIMNLLSEATGTLTERNEKYSGEFRGFAVEIEQTVQCDDLRKIRVQLSQQVEKLKTCADTFRKDSATTLLPLQQELRSFEERLKNAERMASTDSLTEVFNRREGERRVQEAILAERVFCLLVLDLNRFKWINDRYGHNFGDHVLKIVAAKIQELVRPCDSVCRWGGDEFLVIMECGLKDAMTRSRQIGEHIRGRYTIEVSGRRTDVDVSACCGVACHNPGETMEAVFERADIMLYRIKDKIRGDNRR